MKKILSILLNFIFKFFPIQEKIVFESGRGLVDGNPKAIYTYMKKINQKKFKLIWLVEKGTDVSCIQDNEYVYYKTLKSYYHLATAKYWIRSQSMGSLLKKRKNQYYIQTWHGNGPFKLEGYDRTNAKLRPPVNMVKEWDYYIANDDFDAKLMKSATGYDKKIEISGMACIDTILNATKDLEFRKKVLNNLGVYNLCKDKKIVLYAPTFRDFDLNNDILDVPIEKLSKLKEYVILLRLHPLVRGKINRTIFKNKNIINVCEYPDCCDLLAISDILITDYSSIIYQFSPLDRPIIFYPYDMDKYINLRGGFYLDYEKDLPGAVCKNQKDLLYTLENIEEVDKKTSRKRHKFNKTHNYLADGNSSKRLVDKIINNQLGG